MDSAGVLYLWVKAFHIIGAIAWMAGLLYLPRLFVYHSEAILGSDSDAMLKKMEHRLLKFIMGPAMAITWALGLALIYLSPYGVWQDAWFYVKFMAVLIMSGMHGAMAVWQNGFANDRNRRGARFYRLMNEVPTALLILIVLMVVVKPF